MTYFRSYFEKNNTLLELSSTNTAKNPTTEIYYGSSVSRFIFKVDLTLLKESIDNGDVVLDANTKHILNLTNTIFGDETFKGARRGTGRRRATSFDLILFNVGEFWDEGVGFDYEEIKLDLTYGNKTYNNKPSNWFNRTTDNTWTEPGVFTLPPTIIDTIHFDNGDENISVDITDYVNNIITDVEVNYGIGLAFAGVFENEELSTDQSVAFFTKYTQTFFEPFVESVFMDNIVDNRNDFVEKMNQNLYLYVTKGSNYYDLDELPIVDILDSQKVIIPGLSNLTTTKVKKGIYKVTFGINGVLCDGKKFFYDVWKNVIIDGINIDDVTQKFVPKPLSTKVKIGGYDDELNRYSFQFFGIKLNEQIKIGEKRKITLTFRSINEPNKVVLDDVFYRIFIFEGKTQVIVHDWTKLDKADENFFILNTNNYIPREYHIEFKANLYNEEITYNQEIKFEIISEK